MHGITMGTFVPDDRISAVQICKTTEAELLAGFGQPSGRGMEGSYTTLRWYASIVAANQQGGVTSMQNIYVWIDRDGRVAGMAVNPAAMPTAPTQSCPAAAPTEPTSPA